MVDAGVVNAGSAYFPPAAFCESFVAFCRIPFGAQSEARIGGGGKHERIFWVRRWRYRRPFLAAFLAARKLDRRGAATLDDETYRRARIRAAELETSVSAVVRTYLAEFAAAESEFQRLQREEDALRAQIERFSAANRLSRDALHERKL